MLSKTIGEQIDKRKILSKIKLIRSALGYHKYLFSRRELISVIQDLDEFEIGEWIETGCFRFTKKKKTFIIEPKFSFRVSKDILDDLFVDSHQTNKVNSEVKDE